VPRRAVAAGEGLGEGAGEMLAAVASVGTLLKERAPVTTGDWEGWEGEGEEGGGVGGGVASDIPYVTIAFWRGTISLRCFPSFLVLVSSSISLKRKM
jgi:hypothetical protein